MFPSSSSFSLADFRWIFITESLCSHPYNHTPDGTESFTWDPFTRKASSHHKAIVNSGHLHSLQARVHKTGFDRFSVWNARLFSKWYKVIKISLAYYLTWTKLFGHRSVKSTPAKGRACLEVRGMGCACVHTHRGGDRLWGQLEVKRSVGK